MQNVVNIYFFKPHVTENLKSLFEEKRFKNFAKILLYQLYWKKCISGGGTFCEIIEVTTQKEENKN